MLQAIAYCHDLGIVHRDLKPENALIDKEMNNTIKIIDFGTAVKFDKEKELLKTRHGTSYYIAPEVIAESYNEKCDVWSIGVMLYILLSGLPPFNGKEDEEIMEKVKIGKYSLSGERWDAISSEAKALIEKMLTLDYKERISAREALADSWFKNAEHEIVGNKLMKECMANMFMFSATSKM
jgi:calcium-dependent protein kinase